MDLPVSHPFTWIVPLTSFRINTLHNAATKVAPCPRPQVVAEPALPASRMLNVISLHQIGPPGIPVKCSFKDPLNYSEYVMADPSKDFFIRIVLRTKLPSKIPTEKITTAVLRVRNPALGYSGLVALDLATKRHRKAISIPPIRGRTIPFAGTFGDWLALFL
jgi:hypothetical protein